MVLDNSGGAPRNIATARPNDALETTVPKVSTRIDGSADGRPFFENGFRRISATSGQAMVAWVLNLQGWRGSGGFNWNSLCRRKRLTGS